MNTTKTIKATVTASRRDKRYPDDIGTVTAEIDITEDELRRIAGLSLAATSSDCSVCVSGDINEQSIKQAIRELYSTGARRIDSNFIAIVGRSTAAKVEKDREFLHPSEYSDCSHYEDEIGQAYGVRFILDPNRLGSDSSLFFGVPYAIEFKHATVGSDRNTPPEAPAADNSTDLELGIYINKATNQIVLGAAWAPGKTWGGKPLPSGLTPGHYVHKDKERILSVSPPEEFLGWHKFVGPYVAE